VTNTIQLEANSIQFATNPTQFEANCPRQRQNGFSSWLTGLVRG